MTVKEVKNLTTYNAYKYLKMTNPILCADNYKYLIKLSKEKFNVVQLFVLRKMIYA